MNYITVADVVDLYSLMRWKMLPILTEWCWDGNTGLDAGRRKVRDALVVGGAVANWYPRTIVEIGTEYGHMTKLMIKNRPGADITTVNIHPESVSGKWDTNRPSIVDIGREFKNEYQEIKIVIADSLTWVPPQGIDFAFIDGCHDAKYVMGDTMSIAGRLKPGGVIVWHDFLPHPPAEWPWIGNVKQGIEAAAAAGAISGDIYHLEGSWCGLWRKH